MVFEGLIFMELVHFKHGRILQLVAIPLVKFHSMVIIPWDFIPIVVTWDCLVGSQLSLVDHSEKLFVPSGNGLD